MNDTSEVLGVIVDNREENGESRIDFSPDTWEKIFGADGKLKYNIEKVYIKGSIKSLIDSKKSIIPVYAFGKSRKTELKKEVYIGDFFFSTESKKYIFSLDVYNISFFWRDFGVDGLEAAGIVDPKEQIKAYNVSAWIESENTENKTTFLIVYSPWKPGSIRLLL